MLHARHSRLSELRSLAPVDCEVAIYPSIEYVFLSTSSQSLLLVSSLNAAVNAMRLVFPFFRSPVLETYHSAIAYTQHTDFVDQCVTRAEYLESGSNACRRKFKDWKDVGSDDPSGSSITKTRASTNTGTNRDPGKPKGKGRARDEDEEEEEEESTPSSKHAKTVRTRTRTVSVVKRR